MIPSVMVVAGYTIYLHSDGVGSFVGWAPEPRVLCTRIRGRATVATANCLIKAMQSEAERAGPLKLFHDFSEMTTYETEGRRLLVEFALQHREVMRETHVLSDSLLIRTGVRLTAVATRLPFYVYASRSEWQRVMLAAGVSRSGIVPPA